jgi:hypothetical protein
MLKAIGGGVSLRIFLRLFWDPFTDTFNEIEKRFLNHADLLQREAFALSIPRSLSSKEEIEYQQRQEWLRAKEEKGEIPHLYGAGCCQY